MYGGAAVIYGGPAVMYGGVRHFFSPEVFARVSGGFFFVCVESGNAAVNGCNGLGFGGGVTCMCGGSAESEESGCVLFPAMMQAFMAAVLLFMGAVPPFRGAVLRGRLVGRRQECANLKSYAIDMAR